MTLKQARKTAKAMSTDRYEVVVASMWSGTPVFRWVSKPVKP